MTEEYVIEEEGGEPPTRGPFLLAVGVLLGIFLLATLCSAGLLLTRGTTDQAEQIAAIETQNAIIAVTNAAVTQTIAAMETEAAMPTDTPEPTPTETPTAAPTETPTPTQTPVVQPVEEEEAEISTPEAPGTAIFEGVVGATPTPIAPVPGAPANGALPQTGIDTWGAFAAALVFIAILVVARRMRSN